MGRLQFALFYLVAGYLALLGYAVANAGSGRPWSAPPGRSPRCSAPSLYLSPQARVTSSFRSCSSCRCASPPGWCCSSGWPCSGWPPGRQSAGPGVAYLAHLVGFALGFLYAWVRLPADD